MTEKEYNEKCVLTQEEYCIKNKVPMFITEDGVCPFCGKYIFEENGRNTLETAATELITGCPKCHYSYCE